MSGDASGALGSLRVGDPAPEFALTDQHLEVVRRSDFLGRKLLIVFFPLVFTPVCGGELTTLRDHIHDFVGSDRAVVAISTDSSAVHRAFDDREFVGYPLLSDFWPHGEVSQAYGVFDKETGLAQRGTFLVDEHGTVIWSTTSDMDDARSPDDYRRALATAQR